MKIAIFVSVILSVTLASVVRRQAANGGGYTLPDGAELVVGSITGGFTCEGKIYGYYADTANNCRLFHVCVPSIRHDGTAGPSALYSFFCGNQTVFDQQNLVCSTPEAATPCDQAQNFYSVNENFGKTDRPPNNRQK